MLVLAYADDVTVFVSYPAAFATIHQAIRFFELAAGARLNPTKSKPLAIGVWVEPATILGIDFHERVDMLGVTFGPNLTLSMRDSWIGVLRAVGAQARKAYARNLCLAQRIHYAQRCLLAKIWYVAQVFPPPHVHAQQVTAFRSWFISAGHNLPGSCD